MNDMTRDICGLLGTLNTNLGVSLNTSDSQFYSFRSYNYEQSSLIKTLQFKVNGARTSHVHIHFGDAKRKLVFPRHL